jgi:putative transcriptional regulator
MTDVRELLPLYALGILDPDEHDIVERAVAADPALLAELVSLQDVAAQMIAAPSPVEPGPDVKLQLMASIGGGRFDKFATRTASLFDVSVERAHELLALAERMSQWVEPIPGIGIQLIHFQGGPKYMTADCGFVRIAPGATFPPHTHLGDEYTLVLVGTLVDHTNGRTLGPGDEMTQSAGETPHHISAGPEEVVMLTLEVEGIALVGTTGRATH